MKKLSVMASAALTLCAVFFCYAARAQDEKNQSSAGQPECAGPVYKLDEVTTKPHITRKPLPTYTEEARRNRVSGTVVVEAVLCKTGEVLDVVAIKPLPHGLTDRAIDAARGIKFEPGKKDDETVSVRVRLIYGFNTY